MKLKDPDVLVQLIEQNDTLQREVEKARAKVAETIAARKASSESPAPTGPASGLRDHQREYELRRLRRKLANTTAPSERAGLKQQLVMLGETPKRLTQKEIIYSLQQARARLARAQRSGDEAEIKAARANVLDWRRQAGIVTGRTR